MSASEGATVASMTVTTLQSLRNEEQFSAFWDLVTKAQQELSVEEPELPRKKKLPRRFEDGEPTNYPQDSKTYYRRAYFEALELVVNAIQDRFDQPDYRCYRHLEELRIRTVRGEDIDEELRLVCDLYGEDFHRSQLHLHLNTLKAIFPQHLKSSLFLHDVKTFIQNMTVAERSLISEIVTLLKLILVLPPTNIVSERTFSAMRRLKTYLRSTMKQERLNHLLILHVHNDRTDDISCVEVAKSFVGDSKYRLSVFGRFL